MPRRPKVDLIKRRKMRLGEVWVEQPREPGLRPTFWMVRAVSEARKPKATLVAIGTRDFVMTATAAARVPDGSTSFYPLDTERVYEALRAMAQVPS